MTGYNQSTDTWVHIFSDIECFHSIRPHVLHLFGGDFAERYRPLNVGVVSLFVCLSAAGFLSIANQEASLGVFC